MLFLTSGTLLARSSKARLYPTPQVLWVYVCCSVVHTVVESHARSEANCASLYAQVGRRCVYVHVCIIRGVACLLCSVLLNPVTTWCGHTFCRDCICRSFDHSPGPAKGGTGSSTPKSDPANQDKPGSLFGEFLTSSLYFVSTAPWKCIRKLALVTSLVFFLYLFGSF